MQMVYIVQSNGQCLYQEDTARGEDLKICSIWDSFKIVYLLVIGEGFVGADASSGDQTIALLLIFVVFAFLLILHTVSLAVLNLQSYNQKDAMVDSFWFPILIHLLIVHNCQETIFFCGCKYQNFATRLEDMWDYIRVAFSDVDVKDTKWWYLQRDLGRSHLMSKKWFVRIVGVFIVPIWFCLGVFTLGILWPPQIRRWIFSIGMDTSHSSIFEESFIPTNEPSQMTTIQSDLSKMKTMLYDRFQSLEDEMYEIKASAQKR